MYFFNKLDNFIMEAITIHPQNGKQLQAIKAVLKAMKIPFEKFKIKESLYDSEFVKMIEESEQQVKEGKTKYLSMDELAKTLNIEDDL